MRYLLTIILCLWLSPAWAFSGFLGAATSGEGVCAYPAQNSQTGDSADVTAAALCSDSYYGQAFRFTVGASNYTPKKITAKLRLKAGDPSKTLTAYIYSDNAGAINSVIITTGTVASSTLSTTSSVVTFDLASNTTELVAGTSYWISIQSPSLCTFSNQIYWRVAAGAFGDKYDVYNGSWTALNSFTGSWTVNSCN